MIFLQKIVKPEGGKSYLFRIPNGENCEAWPAQQVEVTAVPTTLKGRIGVRR
eukprot:gene12531-14357_t